MLWLLLELRARLIARVENTVEDVVCDSARWANVSLGDKNVPNVSEAMQC